MIVPQSGNTPPRCETSADQTARWVSAILVVAVAACCSAAAASWSLSAVRPLGARLAFDMLVFAAAAVPSAFCILPLLRQENNAGGRIAEISAIAAISLVFGVLILHDGCNQYCGWDQGNMAELAQRVSAGQRPNVDFPCPLPLVFHFGVKLAVRLLGMHVSSFVVLAIAVFIVSYVWNHLLLRGLGCTAAQALALGSAVQAMLALGRAYFWYNQVTCLAVIALFLSTSVVVRHPARFVAWLSFAAAATWVMMAKPNAYCLLPACLLALACCGRRAAAWACAAYCAAGGSLWLVGRISHIPAPASLCASLAAARNRSASLFSAPVFTDATSVETALAYVEMLLCLAVWANVLASRLRTHWATGDRRRLLAETVCSVGCILTGVMFVQTNSEVKFADLAVLVVPTAVLLLGKERDVADLSATVRPRRHRWSALVMVLLCCFCLCGSVAWSHVRRITETGGSGSFFEPSAAVRGDVPELFRGVAISDGLHAVLTDFQEVRRTIGPNRKVFIGPRLAFLYPAFGIPPQRGIPITWMAGDGVPVGRQAEYLRNFSARKFDYLVFLRVTTPDGQTIRDTTFMEPEMLGVIARDYVQDKTLGTLIVFRRR
jgi:hypothetical protein